MASVSWTYRGRDMSGKTVEGSMDAETADGVAERLRQQGYIPTMIAPAKRGVSAALDMPIGGAKKVQAATKMTVTQLYLVSRQLATMIAAGIPLVQSLAILGQQVDDARVGQLLADVRHNVESGETFAASLGKYPAVFPPLFVHMVEAGEASGTMDVVLDRVATHFEKEVEVRGKIKGALTYPAVLVLVAAGAIMALMGFVLPTFIDMFAEFGMELPMVTRVLFGYGKSVQNYWYLHFGVPSLIIIAFMRYIKGSGKSWWDHFLLGIKVFGSVVRKSQTAQFARTFGMLMQSGVPMLQALDILDRLSDNAVVRETVKEAKASVRDGVGLARPLRQSQIFPPMLAHMVAIGEETGALDQLLHKTADFYDREVDQAIQSLTAMIEPAIILVIGVFAAFIVAAVMVPMFNMVNISM